MARRSAPEVVLRLPAERSSFVGRRKELADVRRLLSASRLVTLVGPGGVGKTRLALRAAAELRRSFPDGITLADLTALSDPALVAEQVARALDVRDVSGHWLPARVADVVGRRQVLVVLDNCEHVRDAAAVLVDALLAACPRLRVLATSRGPLDIDGEALFRVPPLPVAPAGGTGGAAPEDALRLLVERATAAVPGLALSAGDTAVLADVCRRLDGLPLAIELAAVRLRTLSPEELAARLDDRFALLCRSGTSGADRHRTLRATMVWSAGLLEPRDRILWRRAAIFADSFDLPAVEAVCSDEQLPVASILDALGRLVDASLVDSVRTRRGRRFRMLESVRTYGRELLAVAGESDRLRTRHRDWCAELASTASAAYVGPGQVAAFDALEAVHAEIGAALQFCLATPGERERGLAVAGDLWLFWAARGHLGEGRRRLASLLAACPDPTPARAWGLLAAGYLALAATDTEVAVELLEQARDLVGDVAGPPLVGALAVQYLGQAAIFRGDLAGADRLLRRAADLHAGIDPRYQAFCWADVGAAALFGGDLTTSGKAFARALDLGRDGDPWTASHALWGLGLVRLAEERVEEAVELERAALRLMREVDDPSGIALCVDALSWAAAARSDWSRAVRLAGAADTVWHSIPAQRPAPLTGRHDTCAVRVREALGDRRSGALRADGAALDRASAVALALGEQPDRPPHPEVARGVLTARQREVADLVARGLTDREIAERLVISPRTAESHVEQILTRLGFRSRAEIAAWSAQRAPVG